MSDLKVYTLEEAAAILKVNKRFLYPYLDSGKLQGARIGKAWRITEEALREFISKDAPVMEANRRRDKAASKA